MSTLLFAYFDRKAYKSKDENRLNPQFSKNASKSLKLNLFEKLFRKKMSILNFSPDYLPSPPRDKRSDSGKSSEAGAGRKRRPSKVRSRGRVRISLSPSEWCSLGVPGAPRSFSPVLREHTRAPRSDWMRLPPVGIHFFSRFFFFFKFSFPPSSFLFSTIPRSLSSAASVRPHEEGKVKLLSPRGTRESGVSMQRDASDVRLKKSPPLRLSLRDWQRSNRTEKKV